MSWGFITIAELRFYNNCWTSPVLHTRFFTPFSLIARIIRNSFHPALVFHLDWGRKCSRPRAPIIIIQIDSLSFDPWFFSPLRLYLRVFIFLLQLENHFRSILNEREINVRRSRCTVFYQTSRVIITRQPPKTRDDRKNEITDRAIQERVNASVIPAKGLCPWSCTRAFFDSAPTMARRAKAAWTSETQRAEVVGKKGNGKLSRWAGEIRDARS